MFDVTVLTQNAHLIWLGLLVTLYYTVITIGAGLLIGLVVGLLQLTRSPALVVDRPLLCRVLPQHSLARDPAVDLLRLADLPPRQCHQGLGRVSGAELLCRLLLCGDPASGGAVDRSRPDRRGHGHRHVLWPAHAPHHPAPGAAPHDSPARRPVDHPDEEHHVALHHHRARHALSGELYQQLHLSADGGLHGGRRHLRRHSFAAHKPGAAVGKADSG